MTDPLPTAVPTEPQPAAGTSPEPPADPDQAPADPGRPPAAPELAQADPGHAPDGSEVEPDGPGFPTRRLLRWTAVVITFVLGLVICWHDNAYAHDGVNLTLHTDGRGSIWADVAWQDGHLVSEVIAAAMTASSQAGKRIGPVPLNAPAGEGSVHYKGTLAAGKWRVVVEAALPGTGTCTADFVVGAAANPQTVKCERPPAFIAGPTPAAAADKGGSGPPFLLYVGIGVLLLIGIGVWLMRSQPETTESTTESTAGSAT